MLVLKGGGQLTAESLARWVEEDGKKWRQDTVQDRKIMAPALPRNELFDIVKPVLYTLAC